LRLETGLPIGRQETHSKRSPISAPAKARRMPALSGSQAKSPNSENAWLGREDSNLRMAESKSAALPLGYAPTRRKAGGTRRKAGRTIVRALPHRNGCPMGLRERVAGKPDYANAARSALAPQTRTPTRSSLSDR
jgi:hypothetical protein